SIARLTPKVEIQSVGSRLFFDVRHRVDSKNTEHSNLDAELLQYFAPQRRFDRVIGRSDFARSVGIARDRLERSARKAPRTFGPIAVLDQKHFRRRGALVDHDGHSANQPLSSEHSLHESGQPRREQSPNGKGEPVQGRVALDEMRYPGEHIAI